MSNEFNPDWACKKDCVAADVLKERINNPSPPLKHIEGLTDALKICAPADYDTKADCGIIGAIFCESKDDAELISQAAKLYADNMEKDDV